ncbi:MAG: hypothetical protein HOL98_05365 [Gammaproteobacteria bacterium]|jgi:hypothetical protein|nr:hypothetical protein [Gammaproteobacteria bacterium]MBT5202868.1 hypothetical protein [Gammaproteobacteria bacterium]MBT5603842.1 hypothetical protein [Gammaproteobacteria bacterium]
MKLKGPQLFSIQFVLVFAFFTSQADEIAMPTNTYSASSAGATSQTRFVIDYSLRLNMNRNSDQSSQMHFLGFDFFRNFSINGKDIGALLIQPYLIKAVRLNPHPGLFDDPDDTALQFRNVYFRFAPLFDGRAQISLGHVELPYGLEREYETNATLRQFGNAWDAGQKDDWGVAIDGYTASLKYDVSMTRGSGNEWRDDGDPYLLTARVGTRLDNWVAFGLTVVKGELWSPSGHTNERERVAVDARLEYRRWGFLGQYSRGKNNDVSARRSVVEVNWNYGYDEWLIYAQGYHCELGTETDNQSTMSFGLRFEPNNRFAFEIDYTADISNFGKQKRKLLRGQIRLRI